MDFEHPRVVVDDRLFSRLLSDATADVRKILDRGGSRLGSSNGEAASYRVNFDLHRAGGLWLWPLLFVFAWSSVELEPKTGAYDFVMEALLGPREYLTAVALER